MPAKKTTKKVKPRIKVEEIVEPEPKETAPVESPKIASFSQLDTKMPEVKEEVKAPEPVEPVTSSEPPVTEAEAPAPVAENAPTSGNGEQLTPAEGEPMSSTDIKEWLKDIRPDTTKDVEKTSTFNFKIFFLFVLLFALLGALIGGVFYYKQNVSMGEAEPTPTETKEVTFTPAPTEPTKAAVDYKKYALNVLNGTTIRGEAAKVEKTLADGGFDAAKIDTGNATTTNNKTTSVSLKKDVPSEVFDKIKSLMGDSYKVEKAVATLKDSSKYDVEIVIGK